MSEIRSVSVRLDADVADYIAKMRLAGAETDRAFGNANRTIDNTNSKLGETEKILGDADTQAQGLGTSLGGVDRKVQGVDRSMQGLKRTLTSSRSNNFISRMSNDLDGVLSKVGLIPTLLATIGPALIPITAAAGGAGLALGGPLAAAGIGSVGFALVASEMIKQADAAQKKVAATQKTMMSAKMQLEADIRTAGKNASTSSTVANAQIRYNQALAAYQTQLKALTPQQKEFAKAKALITGDWQKFTTGPAGTAVFGTVVQGLKVAGDLLPAAAPLLVTTSHALGGLLHDLDRFSNTGTFKQLDKFFSHESGVAIGLVGHGIGNIALGFGHLFQDLTPEGNRILRDFVHSTDGFAGGKSLTGFLKYIHQVGPDVSHTLHSVDTSVGHIVKALLPLGPPILHIIKGIADEFNNIPIPVLTALAATFASAVVFQKLGGLKVTGLLGKVLLGSGSSLGGKGGLLPGGVQKVFVVNMRGGLGGPGGPGGIPGEGGGGGGVVGAIGRYLGYGGADAVGMSAAEISAVALPIALSLYGAYLINQKPVYGQKHALDDAGLARGGMAVFDHYGKPRPTSAPLPSSYTSAGAYTARGGQAAVDYYRHQDSLTQSSATKVMSLRQQAADASRSLDMIGPHAAASAAIAVRAIHSVNLELESIKPTKIQIIAETQAAMRSLQILQAMRIKDKTFTVTAQYQQLERSVAIGGGIGHHADGGTVRGPRWPYGDKVLIMAAPGEEVVSNRYGQADRYRASRMADGGTVGRMDYARASNSGSRASQGPLRLTIDLRTPWGVQTVQAIAREEVSAANRHQEAHGV